MKLEKKQQAIQLREQGKSIKEITKLLQVAKSSVSIWTRHIVLTDEQKERLLNNQQKGRMNTGQTLQKKAKEQHRAYQNNGKEITKLHNFDLYTAGCMLYWAEGGKTKNRILFSNSDPSMIQLFVKFLKHSCNVPDSMITMAVHAYLDNNLTIDNIENYWLVVTQLPKTQIRKGFYRPSSNSLRHTLPYGTLRLTVNDVKLLHQIFGSIKQLSNDTSDKWL